jgi:ribonucrease Y
MVALPSDDMKGRIIGREGRNIRHLESVTGTNLIVDDTPEAVSVSSFDPVRREVARLTLEKLVADGRIHPASIEEAREGQGRSRASDRDAGEWAMVEVGMSRVHPELITLMGRLKYRTSYGQNVLNHLVETANIASMLASELGVDPAPVKRAALLHDIGKAVTHEVEGSHALIGAEIARRFDEDPPWSTASRPITTKSSRERSWLSWSRPPTPCPLPAREPARRHSRLREAPRERSRALLSSSPA